MDCVRQPLADPPYSFKLPVSAIAIECRLTESVNLHSMSNGGVDESGHKA